MNARRTPTTIRVLMNLALFRRLALGGLTLALCTSCEDLDQSSAATQKARASAARTATPHPGLLGRRWDGGCAEDRGAPGRATCVFLQRQDSRRSVAASQPAGRVLKHLPGKYRVIQKDENHVSNLYGSYVDQDGTVVRGNVEVGKTPMPKGTEFRGAPMPYFLRFTRWLRNARGLRAALPRIARLHPDAAGNGPAFLRRGRGWIRPSW